MRIEKIKVDNFRSIKHMDLELNKDLNVIVGKNSSGKSNLMNAFDLVLGHKFLSNYIPPTTDFYNDGDEFNIEICLKSNPGDFFQLRNYRFFVDHNNSEDTFKIGVNCKNGDSPNIYFYNFQTNEKEFGQSLWSLNQILKFIYIPSVRDISRHTATNWQSPLRDIRRKIEKNILRKSGADLIKINKIKTLFANVNQILESCNEFQKYEELFKKFTGDEGKFIPYEKLGFQIAPTKPSDFLNNMGVVFDDGYFSSISSKGSGHQNILILALYIVLAQIEKHKLIIGFEEPEIGLHPHTQRQLYESFKKYSTKYQVIISTHSPNFIKTIDVDKIIRIYRDVMHGTNYKKPQVEPKNLKCYDSRLRGSENEIFFSNAILLVEGQTDRSFLYNISKIINYIENGKEINCDFDINNVSVLSCDGIGELFYYRDLANSLDIPNLIIFDLPSKIDKSRSLSDLNHLHNRGFIKDKELREIEKNIDSIDIANYFEINKIQKRLEEKNVFYWPSGDLESEILKSIYDKQKIIDKINNYLELFVPKAHLLESNDDNERILEALNKNKKSRLYEDIALIYKDQSELTESLKKYVVSIVKESKKFL